MPNLKALKGRIATTKATQRITAAMKMVAAAKLRRAQEMAEAARPYAERMERMLGSLAAGSAGNKSASPLLVGNGKSDRHMIVVISSDRGLCGGFNANLVRNVRHKVRDLEAEGKTVELTIVGRKAAGVLRRDMGGRIVQTYEELVKPVPLFDHADQIAGEIATAFAEDKFDVCTVIYNRFQSALTQIVTAQQLIPFTVTEPANDDEPADAEGDGAGGKLAYDYEPEQDAILADLLPRNLSVQLFRAILESFASEQGARMTAMDNATRNAGEMIERLTLTYNRTRQAVITSELIEIISGAEAL